MTTAASVAAASVVYTHAASIPNTTAVSIPTASSTAASVPTTVGASIPTASDPTAPVEPSEFALDPVAAKEFHDAADDKSIPLADFLRKLQLTENIYGDDTDVINGLTSNTTKHEKEKLKVR
jgi:hypothetical protein